LLLENQKLAIEKWKGELPLVSSGSGMILNLDSLKGHKE